MAKITTLLHISGGLDSVYTAYKWLRGHPSETLLLHHLNLHHANENRLNVESDATQKVLTWFEENDLHNFIYKESSFSYGTLTNFIKDFQIVAFFSAIVLKNFRYRDVNTILVSRHLDESVTPLGERDKHVLDILEAVGIDRRRIKFEYPNLELTRKDMFNDMPEDLYRLCRSCRKPVISLPCRECRTCKQFIELGLEPI